MAKSEILIGVLRDMIELARFPSLEEERRSAQTTFMIEVLQDMVWCLRALEQVSSVRQLIVLKYLNAQRSGIQDSDNLKLEHKEVEIILEKQRTARAHFAGVMGRLQEKQLHLQGKSLEEIAAALDMSDSEYPDRPWYEMFKTEEKRELEKLLGVSEGMADDDE